MITRILSVTILTISMKSTIFSSNGRPPNNGDPYIFNPYACSDAQKKIFEEFPPSFECDYTESEETLGNSHHRHITPPPMSESLTSASETSSSGSFQFTTQLSPSSNPWSPGNSSSSEQSPPKIQNEIIKKIHRFIKKWQQPNWKNSEYLAEHEEITNHILMNRMSVEEFHIFEPFSILNHCLPLHEDIRYTKYFLSEYNENMKSLEYLTYEKSIPVSKKVLFYKIIERFYTITNNDQNLLKTNIGMANCYREARQNLLAFSKEERNITLLNLLLQKNDNNTHTLEKMNGTILIGMVKAFYHMSQREKQECCISMERYLATYHKYIFPSECITKHLYIFENIGLKIDPHKVVWNKEAWDKLKDRKFQF